MAENDQEDRTESATPKRLEDARKRGQVPRSPELGAASITIDEAYVDRMLADIVKNEDLSRYIL